MDLKAGPVEWWHPESSVSCVTASLLTFDLTIQSVYRRTAGAVSNKVMTYLKAFIGRTGNGSCGQRDQMAFE